MKITTEQEASQESDGADTTVVYCSEDAENSVHAMQRHRLLQLRHAVKCSKGQGECKISPFCWKLKLLWKHVLTCKNDYCQLPLCSSSRFILHHYGHCLEPNCKVCIPVKETYKRTYTDEEESELLKAPPKRMRVSRSQGNLIFSNRKSNSFDEGREQRTRIVHDSEMVPIISKLDILSINSLDEVPRSATPAVEQGIIN